MIFCLNWTFSPLREEMQKGDSCMERSRELEDDSVDTREEVMGDTCNV